MLFQKIAQKGERSDMILQYEHHVPQLIVEDCHFCFMARKGEAKEILLSFEIELIRTCLLYVKELCRIVSG